MSMQNVQMLQKEADNSAPVPVISIGAIHQIITDMHSALRNEINESKALEKSIHDRMTKMTEAFVAEINNAKDELDHAKETFRDRINSVGTVMLDEVRELKEFVSKETGLRVGTLSLITNNLPK